MAAMLRRWIIRGLFLTLLAGCVTAWVGSYFRMVAGFYNGPDNVREASIAKAEIYYLGGDFASSPLDGYGWHWYYGPSFPFFLRKYESADYHFIGFAYTRVNGLFWTLFIPLWFPTLISAALLWFAWRKTRPKPKGRAFPVEPTAK